MKNSIRGLLVLVGLCAASLCWVDATQWVDAATGFPQVGSVWMRYGAWVVLCVLAVLASGLSARRPAALARRSWSIAVTEIFVSIVYTLAGVLHAAMTIPKIQLMLKNGTLIYNQQEKITQYIAFFAQNCAADSLIALFAWLGAWALGTQAVFWLKNHGDSEPAGGIYFGMLSILYPCALALERFFAHTSSVYRVYHILQLCSVMIVMLFLLSLLRICFFPETGKARSCTRNGLLCFYLGTCCEFVFSLAQWCVGRLAIGELAVSGVIGAIGVLGLVCALCCINPEEKE